MSDTNNGRPVVEWPWVRPTPRDIDGWSLVASRAPIPEDALIPALRRTAVLEPDRCYRTRMMVHDALDAMAARLGEAEVRRRVGDDEAGRSLAADWADEYDKEGFWSIKFRIVEPVTPDLILTMLRELGNKLRRPASINVGGSCSLILAEVLSRPTNDVDVVNELPDVIRNDHELVNFIADKYNLRPTHFASHYLPDNWEFRTRSLGRLGRLDVKVVDPIDVIAGKFFSKRQKDGKDLLAVWPRVDHDVLRDRLEFNTADLRKEQRLLDAARHNWYIFTGRRGLPGEPELPPPPLEDEADDDQQPG